MPKCYVYFRKRCFNRLFLMGMVNHKDIEEKNGFENVRNLKMKTKTHTGVYLGNLLLAKPLCNEVAHESSKQYFIQYSTIRYHMFPVSIQLAGCTCKRYLFCTNYWADCRSQSSTLCKSSRWSPIINPVLSCVCFYLHLPSICFSCWCGSNDAKYCKCCSSLAVLKARVVSE